ncbi:FAD-containing monooxygenase EthA [Sphingomonas sp. S2M10]|uniref:flavin-containing monooxygenase n=1 Tax=Sphingomonas sp. S2M10 TaxID=2705010 RepID=UPI00145722FB|nr:NAD(P)/FAD-dependent oxidoreductase [Sphingomonas sp. S2M10]NLS27144.1 FAD-containing monooxygenase EthA [Sphingomonas sp. S2M10]
MREHFDVLVVGAGLSGIGAGYHLQTHCPGRTYAILEGRDRLGGTWDLFRYPGIRSDSDMYTLGFSFRPWTDAKAIADGNAILRYLEDTAHEFGIDRHIRYRHKVIGAEWSSSEALWTVTVEAAGRTRQFSCSFLFLCAGYYNYERGHLPDFPGRANFQGRIVHPQFWTPDINHAGKRVVVIGSGATAVTLVPELARQAAHVTMLQRSPTYIVARPSQDGIANWLRRHLPAKAAYALTRWKNVLIGQYFYALARKHPAKAKARLVEMVRCELGHDYDVATHFTPRYDPWDQRLCLVPDADLFAAIRDGRAEVVTDRIDHFTPTGLKLQSGRALDADLVVTATGLEVQLMGGVPVAVDGETVDWSERLTYKGMMFSGVPNFAIAFGYTNASWTLKADLTAAYVTRLLGAMAKRGMRQVTPQPVGPVEPEPFLDFTSGYVQRALRLLPRQGHRKPWRVHQSYTRDLLALKFGSIDDEMIFSNPEPAVPQAA